MAEDRSPRRRSTSPSRARDRRRRERSLNRHRSRSRGRSRSRDRSRSRERSRSRDRRRHKHRRHRERSSSREGRRRPRRSGERLSDEDEGQYGRSGAHASEDNGGLAMAQYQAQPRDAAAWSAQQQQHHAVQQAYPEQGHGPQLIAQYSTTAGGGLAEDASASYETNLAAGLEGELGARNGYLGRGAGAAAPSTWRRAWGGRTEAAPTNILYVRGVPEDVEESELYSLLQPWPGLTAIRITRDKLTGASRGFAFVEFDTVEAAQSVMSSEARDYLELRGSPLRFEYSLAPQSGAGSTAGGPGGPGALLDWMCDMCQAVNFSRRLECYQCSTPRPREPKRVNADPEGPSPILKASGLEPQITEGALQAAFAPHAAVKDVRMVLDKFTGTPRGFAFVHFNTIADAAKAMHLMQGAALEGQATTLKLCFAKDRIGPSGAGSDALQAAQAMSQYSGWAPKEFDSQTGPQQHGQRQLDSSSSGVGQGAGQAATADAASATASSLPQGQQHGVQSGFVYDSNSGYYYDAGSGLYYDANTGLYFDSQSQQWLAYDLGSGQYTAAAAAKPEHTPTADANAQRAAGGSSLAGLHAPEIAYEAKPQPVPARRGAVIGSAPKLNAEGLLAAAQASQAKEEERQKQEALAAKKAARAAQRAAATRPPAAGVAAVASAAAQAGKYGAPAAGPAAAAPIMQAQQLPAVAAPAGGGQVRGVIRSSGKWGGAKRPGVL